MGDEGWPDLSHGSEDGREENRYRSKMYSDLDWLHITEEHTVVSALRSYVDVAEIIRNQELWR